VLHGLAEAEVNPERQRGYKFSQTDVTARFG
jgi:hypothetical protein